MNLIVLGILLFSFGHMFKRLMPAGREFLDHRFGENLGKGFVALFLVSGVILITFGYYHNEFDIYFYTAPTWLTAVMHLLMLISVAFMQAGKSLFGHTSRLGSKVKHPMLTGLIIWSIAHLLVNGTLMAYILFGGLGLWGHAQIFLLNRGRAEEPKPIKGTLAGDLILGGIVVVLYAILVGIHVYLGSNMYPFL